MTRDSAAATIASHRAVWITLGVAVFGSVSATILALLMMKRGVSGPIDRLSERMASLAKGDKTSPIPGAGRGDEIGTMPLRSKFSARGRWRRTGWKPLPRSNARRATVANWRRMAILRISASPSPA